MIAGLGVDAVDVPRFRRVLARRPRLAERIFTGSEREYAERSGDTALRLAARFAAKEAVMKVLGVGLGAFAFTDVEVRSGGGGAPAVVVHGGAARLAAERGVHTWHLSLSHTDLVAVAVVVAE